MKHVLYTGAFRLPDGDAAAWRVRGVAQMFKRQGMTVTFAGWESTKSGASTYRLDGAQCHPQSEFREREIGALSRLWGFLFRGSKTLQWIERQPSFDAIVAYNPPAFFAWRLRRLGQRRGFRVILDSTEWYQGSHLPGGRFGLAALENWVRMRWIYPKFANVICISRFLENHYLGRNIINLPPMLISPPIIMAASRTDPRQQLKLVYAGQAGKKDLLVPLIKTLPDLAQSLGTAVVLRIAGMDNEELVRVLVANAMDPATFAAHVECLGRLSRDEVLQLYATSHFSVIFRENERYALAGFPTKAVESWSQGCPIICNPVGDLGTLAQDMVDAIVINTNSLSAQLPQTLARVLAEDHHCAMVERSHAKADKHFSIDSNASKFVAFIEKIIR